MARNAAWVDSTLQRLAPLLERVLPPLCAHPQVGVREALAEGAALSDSSGMCLVSGTCLKCLGLWDTVVTCARTSG